MRSSSVLLLGVALLALVSGCSSSEGETPNAGRQDAARADAHSDSAAADLPTPADSTQAPDINPRRSPPSR